MSNPLRVLLDTNVLISGIFWRGVPHQLLVAARQQKIEAVSCDELLLELRDVLTRDDGKFRLSDEEVGRVITELRQYATLVTPIQEVRVCRDPKDNLVLACALAGEVSFIVTGDPDLLDLKEFEGVRIIRPRELLEQR